MSIRTTASRVGKYVPEWAHQDGKKFVLGVTSKGIFLGADRERIVFISFEPYAGPLTINLAPGGADQVKSHLNGSRLSVSDPVEVQGGNIWLPSVDLMIEIQEAPIWSAPPPVAEPQTAKEMMERLNAVWEAVGLRSTGREWHLALGVWLKKFDFESLRGSISWSQSLDGSSLEFSLLEELDLLQVKMIDERKDDVASTLIALLGKGSGLTPSGDDLVAGFLLALRRYPALFNANKKFDQLERIVSARAYERTTRLSARLIACAAEGQADERLVRGLDRLIGGEFSAEECAQDFLSYGSNSGGEALLGMAMWILKQVRAANGCP